MQPHDYLACDLGDESGRVVLGTLSGGKLVLEEIHRFPNGAIAIQGSLRWDVLRLFDELKNGLRKAAHRNLNVQSISIDSWGVDYVYLRDKEPMLTVPYHYRDVRTDDGFARAFALVPKEEIFAETGVQFMTINTVYQLLTDWRQRREIMESADTFLTIGDYFNYLFSGVPRVDESNASTTQLYNPQTRQWSEVLLRKMGFPRKVFPAIVPPGTRLGSLLPELQKEIGLKAVEIVATCSHDTAAAVAAVPGEGNDWAYLVGDEAYKTWKEQGLKGNLVLTTSANAVISKNGSLVYDTSKAAANHLVRELAIELAPLVRVKCASIMDTQAEFVISNDSSCLMQIQGIFDQQGKKMKTLHLAEVLASNG